MARSESENRAINKYDKEKVDKILFRLPKGMKAIVQEHAVNQGESLNASLNRAIVQTMKRDQNH